MSQFGYYFIHPLGFVDFTRGICFVFLSIKYTQMELHKEMHASFASKSLIRTALEYAFDYLDNLDEKDVFPQEESVLKLSAFDEQLPLKSCPPEDVLTLLHESGSPNSVAQSGGRYFGFVNGSSIPVAMASKYLSAAWDQNGGLYNTSPINSKLESICQQWLIELFDLPQETVAGFVSGTSLANFTALCTARFHLLRNLGWDINEQGLNGAPPLRIILHKQIHSSVKRTIALLGYGKRNIEWVDSDEQGRIIVDRMPKLDSSCLVLLQAGNANTGSFDDFDTVCALAKKVDAWVHIDGAFGLWAAASKTLSHLTKGIQHADSWAVDGHKALNTPYDCGIVLCKHKDALISTMQATGEYIVYSDQRDPMMYTPEMSKRSRAIELWATMKYLGRTGIEELVNQLHAQALKISEGVTDLGYTPINNVVFNQVLVKYGDEAKTNAIVSYIQKSGKAWLGGSTWKGRAVIRISVCSWATTEKDIETLISLFKEARDLVR